jgi:hypothetical protein
LQSIEEAGHYLPGALSTLPTYMKEIIQGESSVGQATLSRFYALHVVILPLLFFSVIGLHLLSVQLHGMSQGVDEEAKKKEKFFPFFILKDFNVSYWSHVDIAKFFVPYGVILFALNGTPAIIEAHALLPRDQKSFKKALIIGSLIPVAIYILFAVAVVGATGLQTTQIATIGLGQKFGTGVLILSNIFAILAMSAGFIGSGIALKQNFIWDNKMNKTLAEFLIVSVPFLLFILGLREFISILSVAGGLVIGTEAIMLVFVCWQARKKSRVSADEFKLHHFWLLAVPVFLIFTLFTLKTILFY